MSLYAISIGDFNRARALGLLDGQVDVFVTDEGTWLRELNPDWRKDVKEQLGTMEAILAYTGKR